MAKTSFVSQSGIASDAAFRVLGLLVSNALEAIGLTKTADTGQIDWATVTKSASTATMSGYEIRAFPSGTLQTDNPLLVKISYGTSSASATVFGFTIQIGHTTDGAGNFTGDASDTYTCYSNSNNANGSLCFLSCDEEHLTVALFLGISATTTSYCAACSLDRLRDVSGTALATGVNVITLSVATYKQRMFPASGTQFPTTALTEPMTLYPGGAGEPVVVGKNMCFANVYPYLGCAGNPDLNAVVYPAGAMPLPGGFVLPFSVYGVAHNYVLIGPYTSTLGGNSSALWGIGLRYE
jgi:hypothetical protein